MDKTGISRFAAPPQAAASALTKQQYQQQGSSDVAPAQHQNLFGHSNRPAAPSHIPMQQRGFSRTALPPPPNRPAAAAPPNRPQQQQQNGFTAQQHQQRYNTPPGPHFSAPPPPFPRGISDQTAAAERAESPANNSLLGRLPPPGSAESISGVSGDFPPQQHPSTISYNSNASGYQQQVGSPHALARDQMNNGYPPGSSSNGSAYPQHSRSPQYPAPPSTPSRQNQWSGPPSMSPSGIARGMPFQQQAGNRGAPPPPPQQQQMISNSSARGTGYPPHPPPPPPPQYQDNSQAIGNGSISSRGDSSCSQTVMHGRPIPHGYPQHQQQQYIEKPKIDPSQIPRPPAFTRPQQDQGYLPVFYPKAAATGEPVQVPPPADSRYTVVDDGNCSPDLIRSSVYAFPLHRGIWHNTGDMPLGVLCTPLAVHSEDFVPRPRKLPDGSTQDWKDPQAIPVVGQGTSAAPPRCASCHAYVSPFFGADGTCNLCGSRTRNLNLTGLPMQFGTVEYDVSGPYITRETGPVQPVSLYAIDLTCPDVMSYLPILEQVGVDMAQHFQRQSHFHMTGPKPASPRIGVCLVSCSGIVFMRHERSRYAVMSDVTEEPFAAIPLEDWTYDLSTDEGVGAWQAFLREEFAREVVEWKDLVCKGRNAYGLDGWSLSCGGAALAAIGRRLGRVGRARYFDFLASPQLWCRSFTTQRAESKTTTGR